MQTTKLRTPKHAGIIKIITIIMKDIIIFHPGFDSFTSTKQKKNKFHNGIKSKVRNIGSNTMRGAKS
jgi:hypothetical protein